MNAILLAMRVEVLAEVAAVVAAEDHLFLPVQHHLKNRKFEI